jgi:8-amino-7-oxononanoate synthase
MATKYDFVEAELERRRSTHQLRRLRTVVPLSGAEVSVDGRPAINFSSNDYLGLAFHPRVQQRAAEFLLACGAGATASRSTCGSHPGFAQVEEKLAALKGFEKALVLNSGFQANVSLLPVLADRHTLLLADRLNHNSLIQGALLSRCKVQRYRHGDLEHLRQLLEKNRSGTRARALIVTESVFSMDGDRSDVDALVQLADEFQAFLVVDEAHATGVLGPRGMGLTCGKAVDLVIGTFGKACGSFGAYIACSESMWEYILNCCAGFVYSTALPPAVIGAVDAALELIPQMDQERAQLLAKADLLRCSLHAQGWSTGLSTTQIVPVLIGGEREALELSEWLEEQGVLAMAIRPPTVAPGQARIRLGLSALHTQEHIETLVQLFSQWRQRRARG